MRHSGHKWRAPDAHRERPWITGIDARLGNDIFRHQVAPRELRQADRRDGPPDSMRMGPRERLERERTAAFWTLFEFQMKLANFEVLAMGIADLQGQERHARLEVVF